MRHHQRTHPSLQSRFLGSRQHFLRLRRLPKDAVHELVLAAFGSSIHWDSAASRRAGYGLMNDFQMHVVNQRLEIRS